MAGEFRQCPNGHYYQGTNCPYCKASSQGSNGTSLKTEMFAGDNVDPTAFSDGSQGQSGTTTIHEEQRTNIHKSSGPKASRTEFGDLGTDFSQANPAGAPSEASGAPSAPRYGRKLVGWLVTYSFDELGADYKLYEGRNIIGRDIDCNITVHDGRMSGKHAVLLFRANKYSLTDSQSSHGTFVNDIDIELEPHYIKDGDVIRMGNTIFKFRTAF